jgi:hypothetical protein
MRRRIRRLRGYCGISVLATLGCRADVLVVGDGRVVTGSGQWRGIQFLGADPDTGEELNWYTAGSWNELRLPEVESDVFVARVAGGMFGHVSVSQTSILSDGGFEAHGTLDFLLRNPFGEHGWVAADETAALRSVFQIAFQLSSPHAYEFDGVVWAGSPDGMTSGGIGLGEAGGSAILEVANGSSKHGAGLLAPGTYDVTAWVAAAGAAGYKGESQRADSFYDVRLQLKAVPESAPRTLLLLAGILWVGWKVGRK